MKYIITTIFTILLFLPLKAQMTAAEVNEKLGRGVNFGDCFEAGASGNEIRETYPGLIADWGFNAVRIPVKWSLWALKTEPYTIDPVFMDSVKRVVDWSLENKLMVVLNIHHFDEIFADPDAYEEMLLSLWKQISDEFVGYTDSLVFELLNEPHDQLDNPKWNAMFPKVIDTIRYTNPTRKLIIGPADWNGVGSVDKIVWPVNDTNLILTVHYYNPFQFTHQGASWVEGSSAWLGTTWDSTVSQRQAVINDFQKAKNFSEVNGVPVYVGEFGAYSTADMNSRKKWTAYCARTFEDAGFSWAYWEFLAGFGVFDPGYLIWRNELLNALTEQWDPASIPPEPWEISNGSFFNNLAAWFFQATGETDAAIQVSDEVAEISISQVDGTNWHIQLIHGGISLVKGAEYKLSFDSWTDGTGAQVNAYIGRDGDPWDSYSGSLVSSLTLEPKNYSLTFRMDNDSDPRARLAFNLGYSTGTIFLDNINIEQISLPVLAQEITIDAGSALIDTYQGKLQLDAQVVPENATYNSVLWEISSGEGLATISSQGLLKANGTDDGTVQVRASATDESGTYAETSINIANQTVGINAQYVKQIAVRIVDQKIEYTIPESEEQQLIYLYNIDGRLVFSDIISPHNTVGYISMNRLESNIYMLEIKDNNSRVIRKISYIKF